MYAPRNLIWGSMPDVDLSFGEPRMTIQDLGSVGELVAAIATVATLIYLSIQIRSSNRLARAEASRTPNSDLNRINASFGVDPLFRAAMRRVLAGAERVELEPDERTLMDYYMISLTNIQEQLAREVREGILDPDALDFGGAGLFSLPYYRTSWPIYRPFLSSVFVEDFERRYDLDASIEAIL
jgi:hypothetical protein